jgi:hypothetical protein
MYDRQCILRIWIPVLILFLIERPDSSDSYNNTRYIWPLLRLCGQLPKPGEG